MTRKQEVGKLGEDIACKYLIKKGYKIIKRNFKKPWGEIDIIARAPGKTLVFVEVKAVSEGEIKAEDQLTKAKLKKLKRAACLYAGHYPEKISDKVGWRIDLLAITLRRGDFSINHYENIVG